MKNKKKYIAIFIILLSISIIAVLIRNSYALLLDNDIEVQGNSELTYYLDVSYDGVDKNGVESNDTTTAYVNSGNIYVVDKIPEGLTFTGFVTTSDGTIGSVERYTGNACGGKVVDDTEDDGVWNNDNTEFTYHGLHYNANTREVSFRVKNLRAGCVLTVGIRTLTPSSVDDPDTPIVERRRDFYNFANARENSLSINSNIVHAYMGSATELYKVRYEYTGDVPEGVPSAPSIQEYAENTKVGVAASVNFEGYEFSGWTTTDIVVENNSFIMPDADVTFVGSFSSTDKHRVIYVVEGSKPSNYVTPGEKSYYQDETVQVDSLSKGSKLGKFRFSGWATSSVNIDSDNEFIMPDNDVVLRGRFEDATYEVTYAFYDTVLPPNSDDLLPEKRTYHPGDTVTLATVDEVSGYTFLGWYKEDNFTMPEENVTIYGEWKRVLGIFEPSIEKIVYNNKGYYEPGDTITFKITVTNNDNFALKDIFVKENNDNISFKVGNGYEVVTSNYAKIEGMDANSSVDLYATYIVQEEDKNRIDNEVEIVGALALNGYELKDKEYKATASANLKSPIKVCKLISGRDVGNTFQIKISNSNYETWVILVKNECKTIYVTPGVYRINEVIPQEYEIARVDGIEANNSNLTVVQGNDYEISYTNQFVKKGFLHSSGKVINRIGGNNG